MKKIVGAVWELPVKQHKPEPLFQNGTGRRKGIPKGVGKTHQSISCVVIQVAWRARNELTRLKCNEIEYEREMFR